ncbi:protein cortex [Anopheles bellator]|uniref:protein cortex n=1 Tax=Anopheles bellator TaxID=139047 RepID=UPI0026490E28|nr:protein cortex [Anopheles bellator]
MSASQPASCPVAFTVKKRTNNRLNEVQKILQPVDFVPNSYGDRFIPRRYALSRATLFTADCKPGSDSCADPMEMKKGPGYWCSIHYSNALKDVMGLVPPRDSLLRFSDQQQQQAATGMRSVCATLEWIARPTYRNPQRLDWSCQPRSKPIGFIEAVHDLPLIKKDYEKIIDWSANGQIAAIFRSKLVIWTPNTDATLGLQAQFMTSIAFNPAGDQLALAVFMMERPYLRILQMLGNNVGERGYLKRLDASHCYPITCLVWDGTGQCVVCGLQNGEIAIVQLGDKGSERKPYGGGYHVHRAAIAGMKFSCGSKYLASGDTCGAVFIWSWSGARLTPVTKWKSPSMAFFDWHPWREDEIAIVNSVPVGIAIYHIPSRKMLSSYRRLHCDCMVTALSFNKISAELVVCYSYFGGEKPPEILVLASIDRVVDVLRNHDEAVMHLLWSPDGLQLASIGLDETLAIWNFFGISSFGKRRKAKRHSEPTAHGLECLGLDSQLLTEGCAQCSSIGYCEVGRVQCKRNREAPCRALASSLLFKPMR